MLYTKRMQQAVSALNAILATVDREVVVKTEGPPWPARSADGSVKTFRLAPDPERADTVVSVALNHVYATSTRTSDAGDPIRVQRRTVFWTEKHPAIFFEHLRFRALNVLAQKIEALGKEPVISGGMDTAWMMDASRFDPGPPPKKDDAVFQPAFEEASFPLPDGVENCNFIYKNVPPKELTSGDLKVCVCTLWWGALWVVTLDGKLHELNEVRLGGAQFPHWGVARRANFERQAQLEAGLIELAKWEKGEREMTPQEAIDLFNLDRNLLVLDSVQNLAKHTLIERLRIGAKVELGHWDVLRADGTRVFSFHAYDDVPRNFAVPSEDYVPRPTSPTSQLHRLGGIVEGASPSELFEHETRTFGADIAERNFERRMESWIGTAGDAMRKYTAFWMTEPWPKYLRLRLDDQRTMRPLPEPLDSAVRRRYYPNLKDDVTSIDVELPDGKVLGVDGKGKLVVLQSDEDVESRMAAGLDNGG